MKKYHFFTSIPLLKIVVSTVLLLSLGFLCIIGGLLNTNVFNHNMSKGDAPIFRSITLCTIDTIRQFIRETHSLPSDIKWENIKQSSYPQSHFESSLCKYPHREYNGRLLTDCFLRKRIKRLAIIGDSTGLLYFRGTINILTLDKTIKCKKIRKEYMKNRTPDKKYFENIKSKSSTVMFTQPMDCSGCSSRMYLCTATADTKKEELIIEYVAMEYVLDKEITTHRYLFKENFKFLIPHFYTKYNLSCISFFIENLKSKSRPSHLLETFILNVMSWVKARSHLAEYFSDCLR